MSLEQREGVFYYRKGAPKFKKNVFFSPKKGASKSANEKELFVSFDNQDPGLLNYLEKAKKQKEKGNIETASEAVLDTLTLAQERGVVSLEALKFLSELEVERGRPDFSALIDKVIAICQGKN
jgi:predicted negative regulator of RcsB-dependent stress response